VIRADGDARFAEAVRKKLLLEIAGTRPVPGPGICLAANAGGEADLGSAGTL
jgi:hypothetical protein